MEDFPLISAIALVGRSSTEDVLACIDCFKNQTYPHKELILINNAKNQFEASELDIAVQPDVFLLDLPSNSPTGLARNYGLSASNGQLIAQFDIDYWHHPNRLEFQAITLAQHESQISFLSRTLQYSFISGRASYLTNERNIILGTMVHIRQKNIDYPSQVEKHEEWAYLQALTRNLQYKSVLLDQPELCCKLLFTSTTRTIDPINNGLTEEHFEIIRHVLTGRKNLSSSDI